MKTPTFVLEFEKPLGELAKRLDELRQQSIETNRDLSQEIHEVELRIGKLQREIHSHLTPWQRVQIARHPKRPHSLDYVGAVCEGFQELHGDRQFSDDRALVGGPAFFDGRGGDGDCPAEGARYEGENCAQFRNAPAGRLPQGIENYAVG